MRTLTNDNRDFLMVNLGLAPNGRGPYAIRQDGVPPGSLSQEEDRFYLNKDGTWKLNFVVFLEHENLNDFLFDTVAEVHDLVMSLVGKPTVHHELPEGTTQADVKQAMAQLDNKIAKAMQENQASQYQPTS